MVTEEQIIQRRVKFAQQFVAQGASIPQAVKLSGVAESTAQRRGRAYDPLASVIQASVPPPSQPIVVSNLSNIFASPPPSQPLIASNLSNIFTSPQPAPVPAPKASKSFVTIGGNVFSESEYRTAKRKSSPCGDFAPYAQEHTGLMRTFCTAADFANAGYKLPATTPKSTRGKLCPPGETWWGGKCKKVSFSEATFL